jgi:soluble lytic murein transglycosylase-like protein
MRSYLAPIAALIATASVAGSASAREKLHMWTDARGVVHLEDALPDYSSHRSTRAKAIHKSSSSQPTAAGSRPVHWWERATDAPPDAIDFAASIYKIPSELIRAVISVESAGDTSAVSRTGAKGLMQLMPQTAGHVFVKDTLDPAQNIQGGTRYLRELANQFNGDMMLVLAAYNAGPEAVRKDGGVPPFAETRGYVRKVMANYLELKKDIASRKIAFAAPVLEGGGQEKSGPPRAVR